MKKTLIALAAVAASSAALAQSSVTLSGTLDVGFEKRWTGDATKMTGDRNGTSNWTLRGVEDLGGDMKAVFQISTAFNPDTGTLTGTDALGNNGMFLGLEGGFGRVIAGRPVHILWGNVLAANGTKGITGHATSSVLGGNLSGAGAGSRTGGVSASAVYVNNAVQYFSPRFGGLQVQLEYAPKEVTTANTQDGAGVALNYASGPLVLTYTNYKAAGTKTKAVNQFGAAYDFGVARVLLTYRDQDGFASNVDSSYALGVTAPLGAGSLYASYNLSEQAGTDGRTFIAGYKYNLSKRTQAYVQLGNRNSAWLNGAVIATGNVGTVPTNKSSTGYGFGLQHNF